MISLRSLTMQFLEKEYKSRFLSAHPLVTHRTLAALQTRIRAQVEQPQPSRPVRWPTSSRAWITPLISGMEQDRTDPRNAGTGCLARE